MPLMRKTLSDWGVIAEIISAVAVTLSLVFVGLQIRDNTIASQAATYQASVAYDIELLTSISASPETAQIYDSFRRDASDGLDAGESLQALFLFTAVFRHLENIYLQYKLGMLSDESWKTREALLAGLVKSPGYEKFAASIQWQLFSGAFVDYVTQIRSDQENNPID